MFVQPADELLFHAAGHVEVRDLQAPFQHGDDRLVTVVRLLDFPLGRQHLDRQLELPRLLRHERQLARLQALVAANLDLLKRLRLGRERQLDHLRRDPRRGGGHPLQQQPDFGLPPGGTIRPQLEPHRHGLLFVGEWINHHIFDGEVEPGSGQFGGAIGEGVNGDAALLGKSPGSGPGVDRVRSHRAFRTVAEQQDARQTLPRIVAAQLVERVADTGQPPIGRFARLINRGEFTREVEVAQLHAVGHSLQLRRGIGERLEHGRAARQPGSAVGRRHAAAGIHQHNELRRLPVGLTVAQRRLEQREHQHQCRHQPQANQRPPPEFGQMSDALRIGQQHHADEGRTRQCDERPRPDRFDNQFRHAGDNP